MIDDAGTSYVLVQSRATPRIYIKRRKKTVEIIEICARMGLNNATMERDEQPDAGWSVDVLPMQVILQVRGIQRKRKRGLADEIADAVAALPPSRGRPILNGPALSLV
ncbi:hypothetical protein PHMEG_0006193 [Phytophthora megakarya]|uniref:Uncharacterized protein n=1 Tax=Phytophthora megakarya TaxID=4795 RepID=A0A225WRG7_9STRA|nr:hypothetical protein PHMEG_0006193 [Phytophthora megakarya]